MGFAILISTLTIVSQLALSHFIRRNLQQYLTHNLLKEVVVELIATAELCGTCFELIIIADNYGVWAYAIYLFLMTIWWNHSWDLPTACPYNLLEDYVEKGGELAMVLLKIAAQTIGALVSFRWVKRLWMMEMATTHQGRWVDDCSADLRVPVIYGFIIECILTCFCRLISRSLGEFEPKYAHAIDSFFATSMVILAFDYSGGYFNPVLATGLKWGCKGHTNAEHIIVYWAGSIIGSMLSIKLYNTPSFKKMLHNMLFPLMERLEAKILQEKEKKED